MLFDPKANTHAAIPEPPPSESQHANIADLVEQDVLLATGDARVALDIRLRKEMGIKKYGTPLRAFNGRNAFMDLYQELVDAANYLRQVIYEKTRYGCKDGSLDSLRGDYHVIIDMMVRYRFQADINRG